MNTGKANGISCMGFFLLLLNLFIFLISNLNYLSVVYYNYFVLVYKFAQLFQYCLLFFGESLIIYHNDHCCM